MKIKHGWHFPDDETHLPDMIHRQSLACGIPGYQVRSRNKSLFDLHGIRRRHAIDVGANVGLWARDLCSQFARVTAFEPIADFRECLLENVKSENLTVHPVALGNRQGTTQMIRVAGNAGHTHVDAKSESGSVEIRTLDSFGFDDVDYIKIDCEGYEYEVLLGAEQTIRRCRPRICVEQKPHAIFGAQYRARDLLISWGMTVLPHHGDDWVLDWPRK
jgi:FkbM family methyltransferase